MFKNFLDNISIRAIGYSLFAGILILLGTIFIPGEEWKYAKIFLFLIVLAIIYFLLIKPDFIEDEETEELPDMDEQDQSWINADANQKVEDIFEQFIANVLNLVKNVLVSESVVLLFANYSKKTFAIRKRATALPEENFIHSFDILKGLPSLVLRNKTPLIENHLPPDSELLPYYRDKQHGMNSFAGVPLYFNEMVVGVLCVDSSVVEAYSNEDLDLLKHFSYLISTQLINSNKLYEYETENWVGNILYEFSRDMNTIQSVEKLWAFLLDRIPEKMPCDRISISLKQNDKIGKIAHILGGTGNLKNDREFSLTEGVVGWVMRKNQTLRVEDFSTKEKYVPRFDQSETENNEYFSLLAAPLSLHGKVLGAICIESKKTNSYNEQTKRIFQTIANQASTIYSTVSTMDHLKSYSFIETNSQLPNENALNFLLKHQRAAAQLHNYDYYLAFFEPQFLLKEEFRDSHEKIIEEFLSFSLPMIPKNHYIFRLNGDLFAILFTHISGKQAEDELTRLIDLVKKQRIWGDGSVNDLALYLAISEEKEIPGTSAELLSFANNLINEAKKFEKTRFIANRKMSI